MRNLWQLEHVLTNQQARVTENEEQVSRKFRLTVHGAEKKRKTTYMLLTVIVVFLICMLPFQIIILINAFITVSPLDAFNVVIKISSVLAVCSMACNPFIYSFFFLLLLLLFFLVRNFEGHFWVCLNVDARMTANWRTPSHPLFCLVQQSCENNLRDKMEYGAC